MNCLKKVLSLAAVLISAAGTYSHADVVPQVHLDMHRMLQQHQDVQTFFQTMVDSVENVVGDAEPFELHPALDLYSTWNDNFDPMSGTRPQNLQDFYDIDLTGWYPPIKGRITSPYGWRKRRMHKGEDIKLYTGDTVRAAFDGRVRICKFERRGYGNYYVIRHDNGLETIYGHLSKHIVRQGDYVRAGQAIGLGGSTGRSTGPHLHFEMRFMGIALDPSALIDFDTFEPRSQVYRVDRRRAEWAQNNQGRSGAQSQGRNQRASQQGQGARGNNRGGSGSSYHTVRRGDTLSAIARRYGTTVSRLCQLNGIRANSRLQIGKKIRYK